MIPREEILKQINRFYDMLESINKQIEERKGTITDETDRVEMDKSLPTTCKREANKWIYFGAGVIGGVIGYKQLIK